MKKKNGTNENNLLVFFYILEGCNETKENTVYRYILHIYILLTLLGALNINWIRIDNSFSIMEQNGNINQISIFIP